MENTSYNFTVTPRMLAVLAAVVVIAGLYVGAHVLYTSIGSLKGQVAEQAKQLDGMKERNDKVDQMWAFLTQVTQQAQQQQPPQQPAPAPAPQPTK